MRISRDEYLMREAWNASRRSTCLRLNVGAVLVREGRVIVAGYNGTPSGFMHCSYATCGPDKPCLNTVHAEANCIYFAARHGIATRGTVMYSTDSPCKTCAEALIQAGVIEFVFYRDYRAGALHLLDHAGIPTRQLGFIPDAS